MSNIVATRRRNMNHLDRMRNTEFIEFAEGILNEGGKLRLDVFEKVDGVGARFGKDWAGKFFCESSRSGPLQGEFAFMNYALQRSNHSHESVLRAMHYDSLFSRIAKSSLMKAVPNGCKIVCEILYTPMGTRNPDGSITFISVPYDPDKLGYSMTIVVIDIINVDGEPHPFAKAVLTRLVERSNQDIKIISPFLGSFETDCACVLDELPKWTDDVGMRILRSRKQVDLEAKSHYNDVIQRFKGALSVHLLFEISNRLNFDTFLGPVVEGYVCHTKDKVFKIVSPAWKQIRGYSQ